MLFIYQSDSIKGIISTFFIKKLVEEENFDEIEYDPRLHFPFDVWFSDISYEISLLRLRLHKWKLPLWNLGLNQSCFGAINFVSFEVNSA